MPDDRASEVPRPRTPAEAPVEDEVESVPLELDDGEVVRIEQEPVGRGNVLGHGEWPDPYDAEPSGPAPGVDEEERLRIEAARRERARRDHADHGLKDAIEKDDARRLGLS
jgi:hypothetical protein